jgi:hypothetical protein
MNTPDTCSHPERARAPGAPPRDDARWPIRQAMHACAARLSEKCQSKVQLRNRPGLCAKITPREMRSKPCRSRRSIGRSRVGEPRLTVMRAALFASMPRERQLANEPMREGCDPCASRARRQMFAAPDSASVRTLRFVHHRSSSRNRA